MEKIKIKRDIVYLNYDRGGLKMTDFKLFVRTQRIMWIKGLIHVESEIGWKLYFRYLTRKVGGLLLFFSNTSQNLLDLQLPPFYQNMIEAWLCSKEFLLKKEISKFIRIEGQTYFSESLFLNIFKYITLS